MPNIDWKSLGFGFSDVNCHIRYGWKDGKWGKPKFVKTVWGVGYTVE